MAKIRIVTGEYKGTWCVYPVTAHLRGDVDVEVEVGPEYRLCIADDWYGGIRFRVASEVESEVRLELLDADLVGGKIDLNAALKGTFQLLTCTVHVNDGGVDGFRGSFGFGRAGATRTGQRDIVLVKDTQYHVAAGVYNATVIRVDDEGSLHPVAPCTGYAFGLAKDTLDLRPKRIALDLNGYPGRWILEHVEQGVGTADPAPSVPLIPTFTYRLSLAQGTWPEDAFSFYVDSCGNVVPHHSDRDAWHSTEFQRPGLSLRTVLCQTNVDCDAEWRIRGNTTCPDTPITLVRKMCYVFEVKGRSTTDAKWEGKRFRVTRDGSFEPATFEVGGCKVTLNKDPNAPSPHRNARRALPFPFDVGPSSPLDEFD